MELHTKRLLLRPWRDDDAAALYKYASDPKVGPVAGWSPHTSVENSRGIIRDVLSANETYALVLIGTDEAIGSLGLMTAKSVYSADTGENEGEIGYWIGVPFWGQGLIPEAVNELLRHGFEDLGLYAIWCGYYDGNEKSKRVQEKCGFRYHHTENDKICPMIDERRTEHFTRLLRKEWQKIMTTNIIGDVAVIHSETPLITDVQSALDIIASVGYEYNISKIALNKAAFSEDFFRLSTGFAGDVAQKFVNYGYSVAIIGDFSKYTSKPLRDYMYECNNGKHLFFVGDEREAIERLA
jgi:RimJ/RimL family protein N-acetyltransferase